MSIIDHEAPIYAKEFSRKILQAKLDLLALLTNKATPIDDVSIIVPKAILEVYSNEANSSELLEDEVSGILHILEKHIETLNSLISSQPIQKETTVNNATATVSSVEANTETTGFFAKAPTQETTQPTNDNTMNQTTSTTNASSETIAPAAKRTFSNKGARNAGEVIGAVGVIVGFGYAASKAQPIIVSKILEVTNWGAAAETATATTEASTVVAEGAAGILGGTVELGGVAVPQVALAAAAALAVAAIGYGGYKWYKSRQVKVAKALAAKAPTTDAQAEATIEAAVESIEEGSVKSFLKGLLAGAKSGAKSCVSLALVSVALILAAVATSASYAWVATAIYAALAIWIMIQVAKSIVAVMSAFIILTALNTATAAAQAAL